MRMYVVDILMQHTPQGWNRQRVFYTHLAPKESISNQLVNIF